MADRGSFGRGFGGRGDGEDGRRGRGGHGGRGDRRVGRRGNRTEEKKWVPVTKLGRLVEAGHITSMEQIYLHSLPVKDHQIVELLTKDLKDEYQQIHQMHTTLLECAKLYQNKIDPRQAIMETIEKLIESKVLTRSMTANIEKLESDSSAIFNELFKTIKSLNELTNMN